MLKVVIATVLVAHGIGHGMGLLQVFRIAAVNPEWNGDSWLLTGAIGLPATQVVGGVLWTASLVGFAALGAVVLGWLPATLFTPVAIASATASLLGVALFPAAFPVLSTAGAIAVDVIALTAAVWFHWLPSDVNG